MEVYTLPSAIVVSALQYVVTKTELCAHFSSVGTNAIDLRLKCIVRNGLSSCSNIFSKSYLRWRNYTFQCDTPCCAGLVGCGSACSQTGVSRWNTAATQAPQCRCVHRSGHWASWRLGGTHLHNVEFLRERNTRYCILMLNLSVAIFLIITVCSSYCMSK